MKIISKFYDYYDNINLDPEPLFIRKQEKVTIPSVKTPLSLRNIWNFERYDWDLSNKYVELSPVFLFFCGKTYLCYSNELWSQIEPHKILSGKQTLDLLTKQQTPFYGNLLREEKEAYEVAYNKVEKVRQRVDEQTIGPELFVELDCAYFFGYFYNKEFIVHTYPSLKALEFFKYIDPFTCQQEISMFLGNALVKPDIAPQVVGGDKVSIQRHGFDDQSFRQGTPGQKKLNRKQNRDRKKNGNC